MVVSPFAANAGLGVLAAILVLGIAASFFSMLISAVLLWRYRRAVARCMAEPGRELADGAAGSAIEREPLNPPPKNVDAGAANIDAAESAERLYRRMQSAPLRLARRYGVAGVLFAFALGTVVFLAFSQPRINPLGAARHPLQFIFLTLTFVWPALLTAHIVAAVPPLIRWLNLAIYFAVVGAIGLAISLLATEASLEPYGVPLEAWSGENPFRLIAKWALFNIMPTILLVAFRSRRIRAVAPLVLAFMTVVAAGVMAVVIAAFVQIDISAAIAGWIAETFSMTTRVALAAYFLVLCLAACAVSGAAGWAAVSWLRRGYLDKRISDQSLAIDALWLLFTGFYVVIAAIAGPGWALCALGGFVIFRVFATTACGPLSSSVTAGTPYEPALLVLRVFALGVRSERLFDAVSSRWRHIGAVQLVAGMDLVRSTVAPHQFLAFITGRLASLFIGSEADAEHVRAKVDDERDRDGRFRINDFFCRADTWQAVLRQLVRATDVVLMDLRSLTSDSKGCVIEIKELVRTMPLGQVVFVVDRATDRDFLSVTLDEACRDIPPDSPNWGTLPWSIHLFELRSTRASQVQHLTRRLCLAAARGERRRRAVAQGDPAARS